MALLGVAQFHAALRILVANMPPRTPHCRSGACANDLLWCAGCHTIPGLPARGDKRDHHSPVLPAASWLVEPRRTGAPQSRALAGQTLRRRSGHGYPCDGSARPSRAPLRTTSCGNTSLNLISSIECSWLLQPSEEKVSLRLFLEPTEMSSSSALNKT